jgi:CheY-like chemotaxis protein
LRLSAKPLILVVDDEPDVLVMLQAGLQRGGLQVRTAASGKEAIATYRRHPEIDLVLLDLVMPDLTGAETVQALRAINPEVQCCFNTGHVDMITETDLTGGGTVRVFPKPFQLSALAEALYELVRDQTGKRLEATETVGAP